MVMGLKFMMKKMMSTMMSIMMMVMWRWKGRGVQVVVISMMKTRLVSVLLVVND